MAGEVWFMTVIDENSSDTIFSSYAGPAGVVVPPHPSTRTPAPGSPRSAWGRAHPGRGRRADNGRRADTTAGRRPHRPPRDGRAGPGDRPHVGIDVRAGQRRQSSTSGTPGAAPAPTCRRAGSSSARPRNGRRSRGKLERERAIAKRRPDCRSDMLLRCRRPLPPGPVVGEYRPARPFSGRRRRALGRMSR